MRTKEALILTLELANQNALKPEEQAEDNLREIARDQQDALALVEGLLDSVDWRCWE